MARQPSHEGWSIFSLYAHVRSLDSTRWLHAYLVVRAVRRDVRKEEYGLEYARRHRVAPLPDMRHVVLHSELLSVVRLASRTGRVAGSSALYLRLMSLGRRPAWYPNDVDVFVGSGVADTDAFQSLSESATVTSWKTSWQYDPYDDASTRPSHDTWSSDVWRRRWLLKYNWSDVTDASPPRQSASCRIKSTVRCTVRPHGCRREHVVNLVFTDVQRDDDAPFAITDTFDITCCCVSCSVDAEGSAFFHLRPEDDDDIFNSVLRPTSSLVASHLAGPLSSKARRQLERIEKYQARGFGLETNPRFIIRLPR